MPFYWLIPGSQIPFPPGGLEIECSIWASIAPALCFLWLHSSWLSLFAMRADSWLVFNLTNSLIFIPISVRLLFKCSDPRLHWSTQEHNFSLCKVPKVGLFLKLIKVYLSSVSFWRVSHSCLFSIIHKFSENSFCVVFRFVDEDTVWYWLQYQPLWWCLPATSWMLNHQLLLFMFSSLAIQSKRSFLQPSCGKLD